MTENVTEKLIYETLEQIQDLVSEKTKEFTKNLNGKYKHHISDDFIQVYLLRSFTKEYLKAQHLSAEQIAYNSSIYLFETILEYGCGEIGNGHHVAQSFSELFKNVIV